jgi:hypothetical protein
VAREVLGVVGVSCLCGAVCCVSCSVCCVLLHCNRVATRHEARSGTRRARNDPGDSESGALNEQSIVVCVIIKDAVS